jgi:hypothetical protein
MTWQTNVDGNPEGGWIVDVHDGEQSGTYHPEAPNAWEAAEAAKLLHTEATGRSENPANDNRMGQTERADPLAGLETNPLFVGLTEKMADLEQRVAAFEAPTLAALPADAGQPQDRGARTEGAAQGGFARDPAAIYDASGVSLGITGSTGQPGPRHPPADDPPETDHEG